MIKKKARNKRCKDLNGSCRKATKQRLAGKLTCMGYLVAMLDWTISPSEGWVLDPPNAGLGKGRAEPEPPGTGLEKGRAKPAPPGTGLGKGRAEPAPTGTGLGKIQVNPPTANSSGAANIDVTPSTADLIHSNPPNAEIGCGFQYIV